VVAACGTDDDKLPCDGRDAVFDDVSLATETEDGLTVASGPVSFHAAVGAVTHTYPVAAPCDGEVAVRVTPAQLPDAPFTVVIVGPDGVSTTVEPDVAGIPRATIGPVLASDVGWQVQITTGVDDACVGYDATFEHRCLDLAEVCDAEGDEDLDGLSDCDDSDCAAVPPCAPPPPPPEECNTNADEDGDGLTDCDDPDCFDHPFCTGPELDEICDNGIDDDEDGLRDCDDPECYSGEACLGDQCPDALEDDDFEDSATPVALIDDATADGWARQTFDAFVSVERRFVDGLVTGVPDPDVFAIEMCPNGVVDARVISSPARQVIDWSLTLGDDVQRGQSMLDPPEDQRVDALVAAGPDGGTAYLRLAIPEDDAGEGERVCTETQVTLDLRCGVCTGDGPTECADGDALREGRASEFSLIGLPGAAPIERWAWFEVCAGGSATVTVALDEGGRGGVDGALFGLASDDLGFACSLIRPTTGAAAEAIDRRDTFALEVSNPDPTPFSYALRLTTDAADDDEAAICRAATVTLSTTCP
jgi:hypothetical protein